MQENYSENLRIYLKYLDAGKTTKLVQACPSEFCKMEISRKDIILTVFNVMNVILGSGVLGMPYAMNSLGYIVFTILLILFYFLGIFAIQNLVECCEIAHIDSYESMGQKTFGKLGRYYVTFCIFLQSYSAMVSFMYIVKSELPEVVATLAKNWGACPVEQPFYVNGTVLYLSVLVLIVMPLSALKRIDFLSFTSTLAMIGMTIFTIIVTVFSFLIECPATNLEGGHGESGASCTGFDDLTADNNVKDWERFKEGVALQQSNIDNTTNNIDTCPIIPGPVHPSKAILAVPIMVFAFMCQESIVSVYAQVRKVHGTGQDMIKISKIALSSVLVLYWFIAFMSYRTWREATISDMLLPYSATEFANSYWIVLARLCSIVCVIFSAPLLHYPCRRSLNMLIFGNDNSVGPNFKWSRHIGLMLILLTVVAITVAVAKDLKQIFTYGGIISSGSLMIILPNICYYVLTNEENLERFKVEAETEQQFIIQSGGASPSKSAEMNESRDVSQGRRKFSLIVGIIGIAFMGFCFVLQILQDIGVM